MLALDIRGLCVAYEKVKAITDVSISVEIGHMLVVLGPNGAGKTSIVEAIAKRVKSSGSILGPLGTPLEDLRPWEIARRGISVVPQSREIFANLSVSENIDLGLSALPKRSRPSAEADVYNQFSRLVTLRSRKAGYLSGGEQQMLALARAVVSNPKILVLDEPSFGLSPTMREDMFGMLSELQRDRQLAVLVAEQFPDLVLKIANEAVLLQTGSVKWSGPAAKVSNEDLQSVYFGRS